MVGTEQFTYTVPSGGYVKNWLVSNVQEVPFAGTMVPTKFDNYHPGTSVKDENGKEIVSPAKTEYLAQGRFRISGYPDSADISQLYIPFDTTRVDKSDFWHLPMDITFYSKVEITVPEAYSHTFEIKTCGGVKVWVNGKFAAEFYPYESNLEESVVISVPFEKGSNTLVVGCNNYGERNIVFNFGLKNIGEPLECRLPVQADVDKIARTQAMLGTMYMEKLSYSDGPLVFCTDIPPEEPCVFVVKVAGSCKSITGSQGADKFLWGSAEELPIGYHEFIVAVVVDGVRLETSLWAEVYPQSLRVPTPQEYVQRKSAVLDFAIKNTSISVEQYMAWLARGQNPVEEYKKILDPMLRHVQNRGDCSDFRVLKLLWMLYKFHHLLTPEQKEIYRVTLLDFRYWYDEKGNDAMWFFSENHALCFHTSEMLAGQLYPDEIFPNSGMLGRQHMAKAKGLIVEWFEKLLKYGYNEWNSVAYIPVDMLAYISLYELCTDEDIRGLARKALDYTYNIFAKNSFHGIMGTSNGRTYPRDLLANSNLGTNPLLWLAWGLGCLNAHTDPVVMFALSSYEPPAHLASLAGWNSTEKYCDETLQGHIAAPVAEVGAQSYVSVPTKLCKTKDYILGSCITPRTGWLGSQEHLLNIFLQDEQCRIWVNHPGEGKIFGQKRPGYFTGNGLTPLVTQQFNTAVVSYGFIAPLLQRAEVDFTHAFCDMDKCDEVELNGCWAFVRRGEAFLALYSTNGLTLNQKPPLKNKELLSPGINGTWFIKVSSLSEIESFSTFKTYIQQNTPCIISDKLTYTDYEYGALEYPLMTEGGARYAALHL